MAYAHDVLDVLDFFDRGECWNPKAGCEFLLDEMEFQGLTPAHVLNQLNYQYWELVPASELDEYITDGFTTILVDTGLCGLALVAC